MADLLPRLEWLHDVAFNRGVWYAVTELVPDPGERDRIYLKLVKEYENRGAKAQAGAAGYQEDETPERHPQNQGP